MAANLRQLGKPDGYLETVPLTTGVSCPSCKKITALWPKHADGSCNFEDDRVVAVKCSVFEDKGRCKVCPEIYKSHMYNRMSPCEEGSCDLGFTMSGEVMIMSSGHHQLQIFHRSSVVGDEHVNTEQIQGWISRCDNTHSKECHGQPPGLVAELERYQSKMLVIDVYNNRLIGWPAHTLYTSLSYVWGEVSDQICTTQANVEYFKQDQSLMKVWEVLPRTVTDAIILTRTLKIPYLWVDRLCIVQDDAEFMSDSVDSMAAIYAKSCFTIIATDGLDATYGLPGVSYPRPLPAMRIGNRAIVHFENETGGKWHKRAWTVQERALARRCLLFNNNVMQWQCQQCHFTEYDNIAHSPGGGGHLSYAINVKYKRWPDVVMYTLLCTRYSGQELTYPGDAHKAFTGILHALEPSFPGGFFFGLPEFFFNLALMWIPGEPASRRQNFPSWCWLGWDGIVTLDHLPQVWHTGNFSGISVRNREGLVLWKKCRIDGSGFCTIKDENARWRAYENSTSLEPPHGWIRKISDDGKVHYTHSQIFLSKREKAESDQVKPMKLRHFRHPIPLMDMNPTPEDVECLPFIYGHVEVASLFLGPETRTSRFWSRDIVSDIADQTVEKRAYIITSFESETDYPVGTTQSFIAISYVTGPEYLGYKEPIDVLWVRWEGDIAYRLGAGLIPKRAWDQAERKRIDIKLG